MSTTPPPDDPGIDPTTPLPLPGAAPLPAEPDVGGDPGPSAPASPPWSPAPQIPTGPPAGVPGYQPPPAAGPPPGYQGPPGYGPPPGYQGPPGAQGPPGYGPPPGYGAGGYGPPPGYGSVPSYGYANPYAAYGPMPHPQGTTVLVLGILGVVFCCCGVMSIIAWVMGNSAIREIDAAPGRYSNRGQVQAGRILGIVGTSLFALYWLFQIVNVVFSSGSGY